MRRAGVCVSLFRPRLASSTRVSLMATFRFIMYLISNPRPPSPLLPRVASSVCAGRQWPLKGWVEGPYKSDTRTVPYTPVTGIERLPPPPPLPTPPPLSLSPSSQAAMYAINSVTMCGPRLLHVQLFSFSSSSYNTGITGCYV